MPDILVRGLDKQTVQRLKARAKRHGRSLQSEAKLMLEQAAGATSEEIVAILEAWERTLAGRRFARSVDLIREVRNQ